MFYFWTEVNVTNIKKEQVYNIYLTEGSKFQNGPNCKNQTVWSSNQPTCLSLSGSDGFNGF
ncbi:hypothetical protein Hanom_Chr02g00172851 [Helianthus anomalus]